MLAVVPRRIKIRVSVLSVVAAAIIFAPWSFSQSIVFNLVWTLLSVLFGLYMLWCYWPKLNWGIGREISGSLAIVAGQKFSLTFDDGPTPGLTEKILDILTATNIRASFFVLLPKARENPDLIRRIVNEGHELGLHGEDHRSPFFRTPQDLFLSLSRAKAELENIAGRSVDLYRPSHGWKNIALLIAVRRASLKIVQWDLGVWDTANPDLNTLFDRLKLSSSASHENNRKTILLHDGKNDDPQMPAHGVVLLSALEKWLRFENSHRSDQSNSTTRVAFGGWLGFFVVVALSMLAVRHINFQAFLISLKSQSLLALFCVCAGNLVATFFQGLRFFWLLPNSNISALRQVGLQFVVNSGNILLPFRASEVIRPLFLKKWEDRISIKELILWTVVDKFLEALSFLPFLLVASEMFSISRIWLFVAIALGGAGIFFWRRRWPHIQPRSLILATLASCAMWTAYVFSFGVLFSSWKLGFGATIATTLGSVIPAGPASIGTFEAALTWFLESFKQMPASEALAVAVAAHGSLIFSSLMVGVPLIMTWGWPKRHGEMISKVRVPLRYKFTNTLVYICAFIMIVFSFAIWIPESRMPKVNRN